MKKVKQTSTSSYKSPLREAQAKATKERILKAAFDVFKALGNQEDITFKAIAEKASVTEMTVYRHFPNREILLQSLWGKMNSQIGVNLPETIDDLLAHNTEAYLGFERMGPQMLVGIMTKEGREIRLSQKDKRQKSYLKIAKEVNPKLSSKKKKQLAAILQLLQSTYAWDSMKTNWDMNPKEIAEATRLAMESIIAKAKEF